MAMLSQVFALCTILVTPAQGAVPPKLDRSGEPALRRVLEWVAGQKRMSGLIVRSFRDAAGQDAYPDGLIEFWFEGPKFRIEFGDMWGGSSRLISDGEKLLDDSGSDPVIIRKAGKTLVESSSQLEYKGTLASPLFYFREGPALLDRMDKDRTIKLVDDHQIEWDSSLFGALKVQFIEDNKNLIPKVFTYNNMGYQKAMYAQFPEWFDAPEPRSEWKQTLVLRPFKGSRNLLKPTAGKGREVVDQTAKPKPPHQL
jgi:hypothetical protein